MRSAPPRLVTPLSHHEILGLEEAFTRAGRHMKLAASDRAGRKLNFKAVDHPAAPGQQALQEVLQLECPASGPLRLTRTLFDTGADAVVNSALSHLVWPQLPVGAVRLDTLLKAKLALAQPVEKSLLEWDMERLYRAIDDRRAGRSGARNQQQPQQRGGSRLGQRLQLSPSITLHGQLGIGSGGYAPELFDTSAGLLVHLKLVAEFALTKNLGLALSAGYLVAPKG